jgi:hypothetical protein
MLHNTVAGSGMISTTGRRPAPSTCPAVETCSERRRDGSADWGYCSACAPGRRAGSCHRQRVRGCPLGQRSFGAVSDHINSATVEALLSEVRDLLADETSRSQSFITRGSGLIALVGLVLSLVGLVGGFEASGLSTLTKATLAVFFVLAVAFLLLAVGLIVWGVLRPSSGITVALPEVEKYPTWAYISEETVKAQGRRLRGLVKSLAIERERNEGKGRWLLWGYFVLGAGLLCIGADGLILGLNEIL